MASVTKKPRSKYWFACFRDLQGKQRRVSTKQTDRKKPDTALCRQWRRDRQHRRLRQLLCFADSRRRRIRDPSLPAGLVPFNAEDIGGKIYVTDAPAGHANQISAPLGAGAVAIFEEYRPAAKSF